MSEPEAGSTRPAGPPDDPALRQELLQSVVGLTTQRHSGEDVAVVKEALVAALAAEGFPEQPEKWVSDTSAEIAGGRHVVVDRNLAVGAGEVPDEAEHR